MDILVIPDSHAHPDYHNKRFDWMGRLILDRRPEIVVDIGDSADMASLCHYDKGTVRAEGRRYMADLDAYFNAQRKLWRPINTYNTQRRKNKKSLYKPLRVKCIGNHEQRIINAGIADPALHGHMTMEDLRDDRYYDEVYPFMEPYIVEDIAFQHYFSSGVMGKPVGGIHPAATLVRKNHMSCVCGHSHMRDYHETIKPNGQRVFGLVVGCYVDYDPDWTKEFNRWWSGAVILHDVKEGSCEPEFISIENMKRMYG